MDLQFRQGIVRHQIDVAGTATFVRKSGGGGEYIDLVCDNAPLIFTVAHGNNNYLAQFSNTVMNAWGPLIANGQTQYLFWDLSLLDASISFGYSLSAPYHGPNAPVNPASDQHWFDTTNFLMKVWNGTKWLPKLRVFAATYNSSAILQPRPIGTQVALNVKCKAGNILKGKNNYPLRDGDGTFVTSESDLVVSHTTGETVRFDAAQNFAQAVEYIPAYRAVSYVQPRKIAIASYLNVDREVNGIVTEDYFPGEVGRVVSHGFVRNADWNFTNLQVNKPVFIGQFGEITLTPPAVGVTQEIGYVYDNDAIYLNIQLPIIM